MATLQLQKYPIVSKLDISICLFGAYSVYPRHYNIKQENKDV